MTGYPREFGCGDAPAILGELAHEFARKEGIPYPICIDSSGQTVKRFQVNSFPDYYLVDREGVLRYADLANGEVDRVLEELLTERKESPFAAALRAFGARHPRVGLAAGEGEGRGETLVQLSFGLAAVSGDTLPVAFAILRFDSLEFRACLTESSDVIPPADQELISTALEDNAQLVSTTQLEEQLASQPDDIVDEIVSINTDAGNLALQVAMLVPILACLLGFVNSFRMMRLPDFTPSEAAEGLLGG